MDHSQSFQGAKRSRYRSGAVGKSPTIGNINDHNHFINKSTKKQRPSSATINKTKTVQPSISWLNNKSNSYHSTLNYHDNNESFPSSPCCTSYGYIQSLPTSSTNHGWIYHPQYGMIVFTYNEALETAKKHKKTRKHSMSFSESILPIDDKKDIHNHLELPSNNNKKPDYNRYSRSPSRSYHRKYANSRSTSPNIAHYTPSPSPSPSPSPGPPGTCSVNHESKGLLDINHLYVYQPVQFELANNQYIGSPVCNINDNEIEENLCNIDDDQHELENINHSRNKSPFQRNMARKYKKMTKTQNKLRTKSRGKRVFNDSDEAKPENDENNDKNTSFPFSSSYTSSSTLISTVNNDNLSHRKSSRKSQHSKQSKSHSKYSNLRRQLNAANAIKKQSRLIPSAPPKKPKPAKTPTTTPTFKPTMNRYQAPPPPPPKLSNKSLGPRPTKPPPLPPSKKKQHHQKDDTQRLSKSARKLPFIRCTETQCDDNPIGSVMSNSSLRPSAIRINHAFSDSLSSSVHSIGSAYSNNSTKSDKSCISDINVDINDNEDILDKKLQKKHHQKTNLKKNQRKPHKKDTKPKGFQLNMALNIPDDDDIGHNSPVPVQNQLSPKSLELTPSITIFGPSPRYGGRNRSHQKIAMNVKAMNTVQNDDMSLYVFSPKGKHYEKMEVDPTDCIKNNNEDKDAEISLSLHKMGIIKDGIESVTKKRKKKKKNKKHKKKKQDDNDNDNNDPLPPYVNYQRQRSAAHGNPEDDEEEKKEKNEKKEKKEKKESKQPQRTKSYRNVLKMPKFTKKRRKSNSDSLHSWVHRHSKKKLVPFCPSSCQYYVRDACLLQWEGKNIEKIKQNKKSLVLGKDKKDKKDKKNDANNLENMENIYFSMTEDIESLLDELEEKINRLFNNNGGTIYVGVTDNTKKDDDDDGYNNYNLDIDARHRHNKSNSFTFTKRNILHNKDDKGSPRASLQNHIICGIKLNSKTRYKLKNTIISEIIGGFTPNIPHLLNNFDLKFIPVVSQRGTIISRYFVIKITVVAPILNINGEKIQFCTKDGYAHVIDF